jgi:hypothetical protein
MSLQITGVIKNEHGVVTHICGSWGSTQTVEQTIREIQNREYSYYVNVYGNEAEVYVVPASSTHRAYLKTRADTTYVNNLDNLPGC